jgi:NADH-quinone oxidoreductase subunit C
VLEKPAARVLQQALGDRLLKASDFRGDLVLTVAREAWVEAATLLRDHPELRCRLFLDLCGVDYLDSRDERFEVVLHLYSVDHRHHVRLKTPLPESDPTASTLTGVFKGASWFEREAWDLYGIRFRGHPDLRRILLYEEFEGHPLRKDYPKEKRQPLVGPRN